jgi:hypothetical protein
MKSLRHDRAMKRRLAHHGEVNLRLILHLQKILTGA